MRDDPEASGRPCLGGFFGGFNRRFDALTARYTVALRRGGRMLVLYALLLAVLGIGYMRVPRRGCGSRTC
ncbi:hypothetical protein [Paracoccus aminovorans]|uniref:hypothetical protein n=1 Tax=Paracoccus aminovorans TaxID=34004 RepID=UPI001B8C3FA2|nr:hypothetical protein [Paracoccus aminovorans]